MSSGVRGGWRLRSKAVGRTRPPSTGRLRNARPEAKRLHGEGREAQSCRPAGRPLCRRWQAATRETMRGHNSGVRTGRGFAGFRSESRRRAGMRCQQNDRSRHAHPPLSTISVPPKAFKLRGERNGAGPLKQRVRSQSTMCLISIDRRCSGNAEGRIVERSHQPLAMLLDEHAQT